MHTDDPLGLIVNLDIAQALERTAQDCVSAIQICYVGRVVWQAETLTLWTVISCGQ